MIVDDTMVEMDCSGSCDVHGDPTSVAALLMHRFRDPLRYHVDHQRVPLLGHDVLLLQN